MIAQPEPLPYFSLKILQSILNYDITLINILKVKNILPNLFRLFQVTTRRPLELVLAKLERTWSFVLTELQEQDRQHVHGQDTERAQLVVIHGRPHGLVREW